MATSNEIQAPASGFSNNNVRRIRVGLRAKLFLAFSVVLGSYAIISSVYLLRYFFDDKARYVLFSLHQGAEASCAKLGTKEHDPAAQKLLLRQNDSASGFVFDARNGNVLAQNLLGGSQQNNLSPPALWSVINARSNQGHLPNFTAEYDTATQRLFLSACRVDSGTVPVWLLFVADANEALRPALGLLVQMGALFIVLLAVGFGVFFLIARGLTQPLHSLTAFADNLGVGNYKNRIHVKSSDELGVLADSFAILSNRLETRESELEKITELANQDPLTKLWNRRYLDRRVQENFSASKESGQDMVLVYMDADHFKKVNDTYGHAAGDDVLRDFAQILKAQLRETDFAARVGGEEFVMVLPSTPLSEGVEAARRLRNAIKAHDFLGERSLKLTASLGVMALGDGASFRSASDFIDAADKFAYQSKTTGRDRISSPLGQIF